MPLQNGHLRGVKWPARSDHSLAKRANEALEWAASVHPPPTDLEQRKKKPERSTLWGSSVGRRKRDQEERMETQV